MLEQKDEEDGLTEKFVQRNDGFRMDREKEPRFAPPGTFEFEFGMKHRRIDQMEKEQIERVKQEMELERKRLAEEMETAMFDYQAEQIRQGRCTLFEPLFEKPGPEVIKLFSCSAQLSLKL